MEKCKTLIIAVDGHSSTGKSTVAKLLASRLGYTYIDTGAMYRAVTLEALRKGFIVGEKVEEEKLKNCLSEIHIDFRYNPADRRYETYLNGEYIEEQIRTMEVSGKVSLIARIRFVRKFLVEQQREMGKAGGIVMDGRDIGSVVFPHADVKFFMTASPEVRAMRRYKELLEKGEKVEYAEVEENVKKRDYLDEHRAEGPLVKTADALLIDNSEMTIEEEVQVMLEKIEEKRRG
ncbi:(d)CMP kinase [Odoribacter laneus]|mgnify:FL=1|uniref:(d)CMP kinase n=1 Tax=Odoribacter laneus TaxID=626933 RepID=UPI00033E38A0|nr:(d)CMP kinase [Odoribacter laneus]CCZ80072.1 cytidylate kinase [Odoribacter laneus CAG:561]